MNRDEFLNRSWPEDKDLVYHNESQVEFFRGESAGKQLGYKQQLEDQEIVDAANGQAVVQGVFSASTNASIGVATSVAGNYGEYSEAKERIAFEDLEQASEDFQMDILLNHREPLGEPKTTDMELYPSKYTPGVVERWKENPDFPTREIYKNKVDEMLDEKDWIGLNQILKEYGAEVFSKDETFRYIKGKDN